MCAFDNVITQTYECRQAVFGILPEILGGCRCADEVENAKFASCTMYWQADAKVQVVVKDVFIQFFLLARGKNFW